MGMLFSEHIVNRRKIKTQSWRKVCSNKIKSQNYISKLDCGIRNPKTLMIFENISNLPELDLLPKRFALKPIAGNGNRGVFVIDNKYCHMSNQQITRDDIISEFKAEETISNQKIIVEEFIDCAVKNEGIPRDYKFYNFGERIAFIHIIERNSRKDQSLNRHFFIKEDKTPYPFQVQKTQKHSFDRLVLPDYFDEMIQKAKYISMELRAFMRIDLYAAKDGPVFGELAPYPHGGKGYMHDADVDLGAMWCGQDGGG